MSVAMNEYLIEHKIKTLSELGVGLKGINDIPQMDIEGYHFTQWDFTWQAGQLGDGWIASKLFRANSAMEALAHFRKELDEFLPKLAFISQCYMDFYRQPFLIYRKNNNEERDFFFRFTEEKDGVPLTFTENELKSYESIKTFPFLNTFRFLQECNNCVGYVPKMTLLFAALEAMCGKKEIQRKNVVQVIYDKEVMKKILGEELNEEFFGRDGIRNKIIHGDTIDLLPERDYVEEIHWKIVAYFNKELGADIVTEVVSPQRNFYSNYYYSNLWLRPIEEFKIGLKSCVEGYSANFSSRIIMIKGCEFMNSSAYSDY
jgi:hypothetical protein